MYEKAISFYEKAIKIDSKYAASYRNLADTYLTKGEQEKALKTYHKAIANDPNDSYSYCQLAEIFGQRNNERKQITYYKTAAKMGNKRAQDWLQNNGHSW